MTITMSTQPDFRTYHRLPLVGEWRKCVAPDGSGILAVAAPRYTEEYLDVLKLFLRDEEELTGEVMDRARRVAAHVVDEWFWLSHVDGVEVILYPFTGTTEGQPGKDSSQ